MGIHLLTQRKVETAPAGNYSDGGGLYLCVSRAGAKTWVFRFSWQGRRPEMGLGRVYDVPLEEARELARIARRNVAAGINPIEARKAERPRLETFGRVADQFYESKKPTFTNEKYAEGVRLNLTRDAAGLRGRPIDSVDTAAVLAVLKPIWLETPKKARQVREKIENVLDYAAAHGLRSGENPARWRGHLAHLLPSNRGGEGHHAAMSYARAPAFYAKLRETPGKVARVIEFVMLTAGRSGEILNATWDEIDQSGRLWTIPASRMKMKNAHEVPLSPRAVEILKEMRALGGAGYIFPGAVKGKPYSNQAVARILKGIAGDVTLHGFRSCFRDWVGDETSYPREIAEFALAHRVGNAVEAAYRRKSALEKRRELMSAWAEFLSVENQK